MTPNPITPSNVPSAVPLRPEQLCHRCAPEDFPFASTEELPDLTEVIGQARAVNALHFGIGIQREGYNLYAMGPSGVGKHSVVRRFVEERAAAQAIPSDWCYVHHFHQPHQPNALELPPGKARLFRADMERLVEDLRAGIPAAFETEEYRAKTQQLEAEFAERQEEEFEQFRDRAKAKDIGLLRTPGGLALAPLSKGEVIEPSAFEKLPEEQRREIEANISRFQEELEKILHQIPKRRRETQHKIRELNRQVTRAAVNSLIDELKKSYEGLPAVQHYLSDVQTDVIENADDFRRAKEGEPVNLFGLPIAQPEAAEASLRRYRVNVLIDHGDSTGAPVVYEDNPSHDNLVGRIEHLSQMGTLVTDFSLIKPGALHKANGGYLILDAIKVLQQPFAWEALKRALRSGELRVESLGQVLSLISTVSLEPQPIPLRVKIVMVGERFLYYLLHQLDPDFAELFKVAADFEDDMDRNPEGVRLYARLLATLARKEKLLPFSRSAAAAVIDHGSRRAGDAEKLWAQIGGIADLLRESDFWARSAQRPVVTHEDVEYAILAQENRGDRIRARIQESARKGIQLIETMGDCVGQVNGLSVLQLAGFSFGHPVRITARVRFGAGKVIDIEREVELGGPLHSKGVLILSGFLAGHYLPDAPLALSASLVFEQSYGGVEGDSASSAELYALLSALAKAPIRQRYAVTGSVNQLGQIQAIGGVNEKIEGFFHLCKERGLDGRQGVLIPAANVKHLMLRPEVVQAAADGKFHVFAISTVNEGIEILTGVPAGDRGTDGKFPEDSIHGRVEKRLREFAEYARAFRPGQTDIATAEPKRNSP